MTIRWVVFDAVGTLIYPQPSVAGAYHQIGRRFGSCLEESEVGSRFREAYRTTEAEERAAEFEIPDCDRLLPPGERQERARWRWIVRQVLSDVEDREGCFVELFDHFAQPSAWRCFVDVAPALARLREQGFRLAVASNFDHRLNAVLDGLELGGLELRFISSIVGHRKPSPEFYYALVEACGCEPGEIAMIGDDPVNDVAAARAAGLRAWLVRRDAAADSRAEGSLAAIVEEIRGLPR